MSKSHLESLFIALFDRTLVNLKAPAVPYEREYRFAAEHVGTGPGLRKRLDEAGLKDWRFDFAIVDQKLAIECMGGEWVGGAHVKGAHYNSDCEKSNAATCLGWRILNFTGTMLKKDPAGCMADLAICLGIHKK